MYPTNKKVHTFILHIDFKWRVLYEFIDWKKILKGASHKFEIRDCKTLARAIRMKAYPVTNNNGFLLLLGIIEREILYWQVENEIRESRMGMRAKRIFAFAWKAYLPPSACISVHKAMYYIFHVGISYYIIYRIW